jgi:DDE superfamily endonuclease
MEAAMVEMAASGPRERLLAFVEQVVRPLPHVRQRENALLYVRGLVQQGGRKSLQPTLFRLGEGGAWYESVQQFLADSPWDPGVLVRACAERVARELGVLAWIVDDTGIKKDGEHSPGVKRQWTSGFGWASIPYDQMENYVSAQTYALRYFSGAPVRRRTIGALLGAPNNSTGRTGVVPRDTRSGTERVRLFTAGVRHETDHHGASQTRSDAWAQVKRVASWDEGSRRETAGAGIREAHEASSS